jgi:hypothetical protein
MASAKSEPDWRYTRGAHGSLIYHEPLMIDVINALPQSATTATVIRGNHEAFNQSTVTNRQKQMFNSATYEFADVDAIRFQVRRLLPFRPCVSTGAVERVNVSLFTSSWA